MAFMHRFLCWNLRTASMVCFIFVAITTFFALIMRLVDLLAISTDFEISQGFHTEWRSHRWYVFLASDIICSMDHIVIMAFSIYMLLQVTHRHFVMYMFWLKLTSSCNHFVMYMFWLKLFIIFFIIYIFVEFCFSTFEYAYYGLNTFRLAFVVWTWLYWLGRTICNIIFTVILFARKQEIEEQTDRELRFAGEKRRIGLGYY